MKTASSAVLLKKSLPWSCHCYPDEKGLIRWTLQQRTSIRLVQPPIFLPQPLPSDSNSSSRHSSLMSSDCPQVSSGSRTQEDASVYASPGLLLHCWVVALWRSPVRCPKVMVPFVQPWHCSPLPLHLASFGKMPLGCLRQVPALGGHALGTAAGCPWCLLCHSAHNDKRCAATLLSGHVRNQTSSATQRPLQ